MSASVDTNQVDVESGGVGEVDGHQFPGRAVKSLELVNDVED